MSTDLLATWQTYQPPPMYYLTVEHDGHQFKAHVQLQAGRWVALVDHWQKDADGGEHMKDACTLRGNTPEEAQQAAQEWIAPRLEKAKQGRKRGKRENG